MTKFKQFVLLFLEMTESWASEAWKIKILKKKISKFHIWQKSEYVYV